MRGFGKEAFLLVWSFSASLPMIEACILIVVKQLRGLSHLKKIPDSLKINDKKLNPIDHQAFNSETPTGMQ